MAKTEGHVEPFASKIASVADCTVSVGSTHDGASKFGQAASPIKGVTIGKLYEQVNGFFQGFA